MIMTPECQVAKNNRKYFFLLGIIVFVIYLFTAAQPIPEETILRSRWLSSLEANYPVYLEEQGGAEPGLAVESGSAAEAAPGTSTVTVSETAALLPFRLGNRFGYIDHEGRFIINRVVADHLSISRDHWAEYEAAPADIEVRDSADNAVMTIAGSRGYPLFLDNRVFLISEDQTSLRAVDETGEIRWSYDFAAPITDIDAAASLVLVGFLDGTVELLDDAGKRVFFFEPGGSRLSVICGVRISRDGSHLAIISGYDDQRFLLLEKSGASYKVAYHEFLADGFRRAVYLAFIDNDRRVVFEWEKGLGIYDINTRNSVKVPLDGAITALDESGADNLLFLITSQTSVQKELVGIRLPGEIIMEAPFRSDKAFLGRQGKLLYIGGGSAIASFEIGKR
jgi:hypothetical protein